MSTKTPKNRSAGSNRHGVSQGSSVDPLQNVLTSLHLRLSASDLIAALEAMRRDDSAVDFSARDRDFWAAHSGITADAATVARSSAANAAAQVLMHSSSLTTAEVAEYLSLSASTVRHYKAERKLYSYITNGRLLFPTWQFIQQGRRRLPALDRVLRALPVDLHPQAVAGFFQIPKPNLTVGGEAISVAAWLENGYTVEPVLAMAGALAAGD
jgi:hypothetical protein